MARDGLCFVVFTAKSNLELGKVGLINTSFGLFTSNHNSICSGGHPTVSANLPFSDICCEKKLLLLLCGSLR